MKLLTVATVVLMLTMSSCTPANVMTTLEASVAATEVLVAALMATGQIPPAVGAQISAALVYLPAAFQSTTAELASTDAAALKVTKITGYYTAALNALHALPPEAQIWTNAVVAAINAFLKSLEPAAVTTVQTYAVSRGGTGKFEQINGRVFELTEKISKLQRR